MSIIYINPFQFAAAGPWTPAEITTALWLDAADSSTVTTVSGAVSQWDDKSGNGRDFAQNTTSLRPILTTNGLGGLPIITFDGTNDYLSSATTTGSSTATVAIVWKLNQLVQNERIYDIKTGFGGLQLLRDNLTSTICTKSSFYQSGLVSDQWFTTALSTELTIQRFDTNSTLFNRNGSVITGTTGLNVGEAGSVSTIGARADLASTTYLDGSIAELVVVNGISSVIEVQKLEGYLAHKWGLTANLPAGHPYKSAAPTV